MNETLAKIKTDFYQLLKQAADKDALTEIWQSFLGRKGELQGLFKSMKGLSAEDRPKFGQLINELKKELEASFNQRQDEIKQQSSLTSLDLSLPGVKPATGTLHPLQLMQDKLCEIFIRMGFTVEEGPEVETEYNNFDALNTPFWHPARVDSDSLYLDNGHMLRTETSPVQIRTMQKTKPPLRIIAPGRVYRNDKPDATHSPMFMQVEGLYIDHGVTFADLKGTLLEFYRQIFGEDTQIRFRPHYFPFTEPSAEVDVTCIFCRGKGCRVCKQSGWIEMGGCGMVDPKVLEEQGLDSEELTGFAFGLGVERMAMLLYGVDDIRLFYENDLRFLKQFS
jgi:phenylalanyl-tRNA synthetase alpha chain